MRAPAFDACAPEMSRAPATAKRARGAGAAGATASGESAAAAPAINWNEMLVSEDAAACPSDLSGSSHILQADTLDVERKLAASEAETYYYLDFLHSKLGPYIRERRRRQG